VNSADGRYLRRPWDEDERTPRYDYVGPWATNEERLTGQALAAATVPGEDLSELVRPNISQIQLFPPRFGYRKREIGIRDIMDVDEIYQQPRTNFQGGLAGFEGTSRNAQGTGSW
jgi:hypothetical protein